MGYKTQTIDIKPLRDLTRLHDISVADIATRTGISTSAIYTWLREGEMPSYMLPVCQGILAAVKGQGTGASKDANTETLIVRIPPSQRDAAEKMLSALGAKFKVIDDL